VYRYIASQEIRVNGQRTDGQKPDGRPNEQPENIMLSTYYCWRRHKKQNK